MFPVKTQTIQKPMSLKYKKSGLHRHAPPTVCWHHSRNGKCRNGEAQSISVHGIYEYSEGQTQSVSTQTKK